MNHASPTFRLFHVRRTESIQRNRERWVISDGFEGLDYSNDPSFPTNFDYVSVVYLKVRLDMA